jgi:site-specific DNA-adenine methylase
MKPLDVIRKYKRGRIDSLSMTVAARVRLAWAFWVKTNFSHMNKLNGGYKQEKDGGCSIAQSLQNRKDHFTELMVARIENCTIENTDYLTVLKARNSVKAFHHVDPIYPDTDHGTYGYFGHKWTWDDYEQLLSWLATDCKGKFLLTSYNNEMLDGYTKIYEWSKKEISHLLKTPRKGGTQTHRTEVLISNYGTPCGTLSLF